MVAADKIDIAAENAGLHAFRADRVIGNEQKFFACDPFVMFDDRWCEFVDATGGGVALQDQVEDRHEVAFAATKAAMQIGRLADVVLEGATNEVEGVIEAFC